MIARIVGVMAITCISFLLEGCVEEGYEFSCVNRDVQCAREGIAEFQHHVLEQEANVDASLHSFLLLQNTEHPSRDTDTVVLVHGFTGSPLHMNDIANLYFAQGYNVIAILLRGHGTSIEDMDKQGKLVKWRKDVAYAVSIAHALSDKVMLGGHSLGGALAMEYAIDHADVIHSLALFDPLIALHEQFQAESIGSCAAPLLEVVAGAQINTLQEYMDVKQAYGITSGITNENFEIFPPGFPGAYDDASMKSICSLLRILKRFNAYRHDIKPDKGEKLHWYTLLETIPNVLMVYSADPANIVSETVNRTVMAFVSEHHPDNNYHVLELPAASKIAHGVVLDSQLNSLFPAVETALTAFIQSQQ